jgi:CBS domain-containing protein
LETPSARNGTVKVADLMQTKVVTVRPDASVAEVIATLADAHVSAAPVVNPHGQVVGVVSSSDVLNEEAEASNRNARTMLLEATLAQDIMTPRPLTIEPQADVRDAAREMLYAEVHRLFVVSEERLVGVISTTDIVRAVATGKL